MSISSPGAFPASLSVTQDSNGHKTMTDGYGLSSDGSFAWYDLDTSCWKMCQALLNGDYPLFSGTWPLTGSMRGGNVFQQPTSEHRISVGASLLWPTVTVKQWPTPLSTEGLGGAQSMENRIARSGTGPRLRDVVTETDQGPLNPEWVEALMGFPIGWTDIDGLPDKESPSTTGSHLEPPEASRTGAIS